ncbi:hypothetical protein MN116_002196 [Schistosoma mekongi]|uniref:Uncharacterized protein n=1 Tax=Schistosoma mekongi TaxID=38744 RepID=A0AAE2D8L7_SCHME|nr:hypothetical protein MN116_002196 [Schistosoma mekongi]
MRLRDRFHQETSKQNYNSETIQFTSSPWLQQLLSIAIRLNNATSIHETILPLNQTNLNDSISTNIQNISTSTTTIGTTGCIILEFYDKNPNFLYDQEDFHDIDYSVLKMQIIVWTEKYLKPDDLFLDWFETVNKHIYNNNNNNKKVLIKMIIQSIIIIIIMELLFTNITFCTENLKDLMIDNEKEIFNEMNIYNLSSNLQTVKNETKSNNYIGNEVQIFIVIILCCVLIICFVMAIVLRIKSFCKRQTESRKQIRSDRDSALQINFPYDVKETQVEDKPPVPSTTFGSNVYPGLVKKRIGVYRYNRIPASYYNSIQKYNRILNAQTYQPSTVFVLDYQGTDNLNVSHDEYSPNQEFPSRYLSHQRQSEKLVNNFSIQTSNYKTPLRSSKNDSHNQHKTMITTIERNYHFNKSIQRTYSF